MFFIDTMIAMASSKPGKFMDVKKAQSKQADWLQKELGKSSAEWKIVIGHHPIYYEQGIQRTLLSRLDPILRKHGVQLYITGHDHTKQILQKDGLTYVISGAGGANVHNRKDKKPSYLKKFYKDKGFASLEICDKDRATLKLYNPDGKEQAKMSVSSKSPKKRENVVAASTVEDLNFHCSGRSLFSAERECSRDGCTVVADIPANGTCSEFCSNSGLDCIAAWDHEDECEFCLPTKSFGCDEPSASLSGNRMCRCAQVPEEEEEEEEPEEQEEDV